MSRLMLPLSSLILPRAVAVAGLVWLVGLAGCDGNQPPLDAVDPEGVPTAEIAIRIDAPAHGAPSASLLAFHADLAGIETHQVLAAVDPLMVAPPAVGCTLQAVDEMANRLRDRDGWVELRTLGDIHVDLGDSNGSLRASPSVYPDLATMVAGVVGEAGPIDLTDIPDLLRVRVGRDAEADLTPPAFGSAYTEDGATMESGRQISVRADLQLNVSGLDGTFIEIRPFGTTLWAACAAVPIAGTDQAQITVPAAILQKLARLSGEVPVSFDVVWRDLSTLDLPSSSTSGLPVRVSLETRTSALVELVP